MAVLAQRVALKNYNWDIISHETFVPLPSSENDADWSLDMLEWLQGYKDYWLYYNFFPYFMTTSGHC